MIEQGPQYTPEKAQEEADRMRAKIESGQAKDYPEAEKQVGSEKRPIANIPDKHVERVLQTEEQNPYPKPKEYDPNYFDLLDTEDRSDEEIVEETKQILKHIDFETLSALFEERRRRSHIIDDRFEGIDLTHFPVSGTLRTPPALFILKDRKFILGPIMVAREFIEDPTDFRRAILSAVFHETTHFSAFHRELNSFEKFIEKVKAYYVKRKPIDTRIVGYQRIQDLDINFGADFDYFDESVTDIIAGEIYAEYLSRTGDRSFFASSEGNSNFMEGRPGSRRLLAAFIAKIADASNVASDVVWGAIQQGYFSGLNLKDSSLGHFFEETYYPEFLNELSQIGESDRERDTPMRDIENIITKLAAQPILENGSDYFKRFLDELERVKSKK